MEIIQTTLSSTSFWFNLLELKNRMKIPLPTDVIVFRCGTCKTNLPLNKCGSIILKEPLQEEMTNVIYAHLKCVINTRADMLSGLSTKASPTTSKDIIDTDLKCVKNTRANMLSGRSTKASPTISIDVIDTNGPK